MLPPTEDRKKRHQLDPDGIIFTHVVPRDNEQSDENEEK